jgi:hypothetical protein
VLTTLKEEATLRREERINTISTLLEFRDEILNKISNIKEEI